MAVIIGPSADIPELLVDDLFEGVEWAVADELPAVDEKGRGAEDEQVRSELLVPLNLRRMPFPVDGFRKLFYVEAELARISDETGPIELRGTRKEQLIHFPVLALVPRRKRRLGRDMGVIPQDIGEILDDKPDLPLIGIPDLPDGRTGRRTVRSLEVEKFDHGHRRIGGADSRGISDGN